MTIEETNVKRIWMRWICGMLAILATFVLAACTVSSAGTQAEKPTVASEAHAIGDLQRTEYFTEQALHHIFEGELNKGNKVVGYHHEGMASAKAHVEEGSRSTPDADGVYSGKVYIGTKLKDGNNGYSTFFPKEWTPQQVVDAINYAWEHRERRTESQYAGKTKDGVTIMFYTDASTGKIATAYPVKKKK